MKVSKTVETVAMVGMLGMGVMMYRAYQQKQSSVASGITQGGGNFASQVKNELLGWFQADGGQGDVGQFTAEFANDFLPGVTRSDIDLYLANGGVADAAHDLTAQEVALLNDAFLWN